MYLYHNLSPTRTQTFVDGARLELLPMPEAHIPTAAFYWTTIIVTSSMV